MAVSSALNILPSRFLTLGTMPGLPKIESLQQKFGMRLEYILPLPDFPRQRFSIGFELFIGDSVIGVYQLEQETSFFNSEIVLVVIRKASGAGEGLWQ